MYNFSNEIPSKPKALHYIDIGIHENLYLDAYEYKVSDKGNKFITLTFKNTIGEEHVHTEWEPGDKDEDVLANKIENQMTRFRYVIKALIPDKDFEFTATGFEDFCNKYIDVLKAHYSKGLVRAKIIYNNKNFTTFPKYLFATWIEPMSIPKEYSKIRMISNIDKTEKTENPDSPYNSTTVNASTTGEISGDELPF